MGRPTVATDPFSWCVVGASLVAAAPVLVQSFAASDDGGAGVSLWAMLLAAVWFVGGGIVLWRRRRLVRLLEVDPDAGAEAPSTRHAIRLTLLVGLGLAASSLVGGLVLAAWPPTRFLVEGPLAAATSQQPLLLFGVALIAGAAEEVFFRLALPTLLPSWWRWVVPTVLYGAVTLFTGTLALAAMAVVLGLVAAWTLERARRWYAPIVVHALWTVAMVVVFPMLAA